MAKIQAEILFATVSEDASGILIRARNVENNELLARFVPAEVWGKIPPDKDPRKELQDIADSLNKPVLVQNPNTPELISRNRIINLVEE